MSEETPKPAEPSERSLVPATLASIAILLVAGVIIFWPGDDGNTSTSEGQAEDGATPRAEPGSQEAADSGVRAREVDAAQGSRPNPRINPAIALPDLDVAPPGPPPEPPTFTSKEEEIAYWEKRLESARQSVTMRQKFVERLPRAKERFMAAEGSATNAEARWASREKTVRDNLASAERKVTELEQKVAALREK